MDSSSAFAPAVLERWRRRENLLPGLALMALAVVGWAYVAYQAASTGSMHSVAMGGMEMGGIGEAALFLLAWTAMMVAMMVPATLPLILLYRTIARNRLDLLRARAGVVIVLLGYIAVWALARATSVRLRLVGRCCRVLGGAFVCLAAHHRRGLPVHFVTAHLPRSLQQPIVLRDAQLAAWSYGRSASGDAPRRRVPGLLRRADGGLGGSRDDEPSLDAYSLAHHLCGEETT